MVTYELTILTWNRFAQYYRGWFMNMDLYQHTYAALCELTNPDLPVLELGCGPGIITYHIIQAHPDIRIMATDASAAMIALTPETFSGATYAQLDCRYLSIIEGSFGMIIAGFCLPYLATAEARKWIGDMNDE